MIIKEGNKNKLVDVINYNNITKGFSIILIILIAFLSFTSLGVYIQYSGKTGVLKGWVKGIYNDKLEFIPNYLRSLVVVPEHIDINIKFEDYQKLAHKRQEALILDRLLPSKNDWVPAEIKHNDNIYKAKIRLKGDLKDHWQKDEMWSFKIKISGKKTLFGMKRFAIQSPNTRGYLNEYILHKLFEYNKLISLRYDFISVTINGREQSIYALEENFDKLMIENNGLREGPIFQIEPGQGINYTDSEILWGTIEPYQRKKMTVDETLLNQFGRAKTIFVADMEHGSISEGDLPALFQVLNGTDYIPMVRVANNNSIFPGNSKIVNEKNKT